MKVALCISKIDEAICEFRFACFLFPQKWRFVSFALFLIYIFLFFLILILIVILQKKKLRKTYQ